MNQQDCDVTFKFKPREKKSEKKEGEETKEKTPEKEEKLPRAHLFVLQSRCPNMVGTNPTKKEENGKPNYDIEIEQISCSALCEVLRFLYTEKVHLKVENAFDVLRIARTYKITPLEQRCEAFIVYSSITIPTVCKVMKDSIEVQDNDLMSTCAEFISDNTAQILADKSFMAADESVVEKICQLDYLGVTEIDLFKKCVAWARFKKGNNELVGKDLRSALGGILNHIRFPVMKLEDYCQFVQDTKVLEDEENVEIYTYIARPEGNKPIMKNYKAEPRQMVKHAEVPVPTGDRDKLKRNKNISMSNGGKKDSVSFNDYFNDDDADSVWSGLGGDPSGKKEKAK
jgi:hypothetical protein